MPRSRNIKPSLFKNELLGEADPLLTILFAGLWCLADRDGKMEDRPKRIKAEIFPYRELPLFNGYLTELEQLGFIERYTVENAAIIRVINFDKHQSPHKTEKASELSDRPINTGLAEITVKAPLDDETPTVKESLIPDSCFLIPEERGALAKPKTKMTIFKPPAPSEVSEYMTEKGVSDMCEAERFCDFYQAKNWMVGKNKMKDWKAGVRNWLRRRNEYGKKSDWSAADLATHNDW